MKNGNFRKINICLLLEIVWHRMWELNATNLYSLEDEIQEYVILQFLKCIASEVPNAMFLARGHAQILLL